MGVGQVYNSQPSLTLHGHLPVAWPVVPASPLTLHLSYASQDFVERSGGHLYLPHHRHCTCHRPMVNIKVMKGQSEQTHMH